jgi:molybdopterin adenylyltransferase
MGHREHRLSGPSSVPCAVLTISDTRDPRSDASGALILRTLRRAGHAVVDYRIVKDDPARITAHLKTLARGGRARIALLTGGTGISRRDSTYEAVSSVLDKRLDGFGEIFRLLSYREIGPAAMLSRALAGTVQGMAVFCMPGSEEGVHLAMTKLVLPELSHVAGLLAKDARGKRHARRD